MKKPFHEKENHFQTTGGMLLNIPMSQMYWMHQLVVALDGGNCIVH